MAFDQDHLRTCSFEVFEFASFQSFAGKNGHDDFARHKYKRVITDPKVRDLTIANDSQACPESAELFWADAKLPGNF